MATINWGKQKGANGWPINVNKLWDDWTNWDISNTPYDLEAEQIEEQWETMSLEQRTCLALDCPKECSKTKYRLAALLLRPADKLTRGEDYGFGILDSI